MEIEKHQTTFVDIDNISESGSVTNELFDAGDHLTDSAVAKGLSNGDHGSHYAHSRWNLLDKKQVRRNGNNASGDDTDITSNDVSRKPCLYS